MRRKNYIQGNRQYKSILLYYNDPRIVVEEHGGRGGGETGDISMKIETVLGRTSRCINTRTSFETKYGLLGIPCSVFYNLDFPPN